MAVSVAGVTMLPWPSSICGWCETEITVEPSDLCSTTAHCGSACGSEVTPLTESSATLNAATKAGSVPLATSTPTSARFVTP